MKLHRLEADIDPRNARSIRLVERLGFKLEGHLRERYLVGDDIQDSLMYGVARHGVDGSMRPEERFSNRVSDYLSGRPGYPDAAVFWLTDTFELAPPAMIADVGAGTGISAALLISHGFDVVAIEPNDAMRAAAIERSGLRSAIQGGRRECRSHHAAGREHGRGDRRSGVPLVRSSEVSSGVRCGF